MVWSVTLAPATALSRTLPAISLARSSAEARRLRASPTFSPATSAVAAISARASSASEPMSLLVAGVGLFIVLVFSVGWHFSVVNFPRQRDGLLAASWPPAEPSFCRRTDWARIPWPADQASIGRPR